MEINKEFIDMIGRTTASEAYLDYCMELYGYRMSLYNMMDKSQLDFLFDSIPVTGNDSILDLGCGSGCILKHLMQKYECRGVGLDQLEPEFVVKQSGSIPYIVGNIDELDSYGLDPSIVISVDSLYFSNDLDHLLKTLTHRKGNRLYLYYSQYIFDDKQEDKDILKYNNTRLAKILNKEGIRYRVVDYSENERNLYKRAIQILPGYQDAFEREGIRDIFEKKHNENKFGKELYDSGRASRFLYMIE